MTPIERVRAKATALETLGLRGAAGPSDLRKAYKKRVVSVHPDTAGGSHEAFVAVRNAYEFLLEDFRKTQDRVVPKAPARRDRPVSRPVETVFDLEDVAACSKLQERDEFQCSARHIAVKMLRRGRTLTYFVPTALRSGLNKVAMPAPDLGDAHGTRPVMVTIRSSGAGESQATLPQTLASRLFPGAREVHLCFGD